MNRVAGGGDADIPLLRPPPFPGARPVLSRSRIGDGPSPLDESWIEHLFAAIREGQVGGRFWSLPARTTGHRVVIRANSAAEIDQQLARLGAPERESALGLLPTDDIDPWSVLKEGVRLIAHGDDEWSALALIAGCSVDCLSAGRWGAPGASKGRMRRDVASALTARGYRDPFTGHDCGIEATIVQLADWRRTFAANRGIVAACGIAWWKRREIARFLWTPEHRLRFFRSERRAIAHAARAAGAVAIWPSRVSPAMANAAHASAVPLVRVEDGFVRSVGLGSQLVPPSSVAVDRIGIHYDPEKPSDLETLLARADFPSSLLERAARLQRAILAAGISKYGGDEAHAFPQRATGRRLVLVPGQVEDDMSVRLGGGGLSSNLELLRRARALEPDAEIWFRPHPDVDAGHRRGLVRDADAMRHADRVVRGGAMARLLDLVDSVHVLTSLTGFEALLRGRAVTCHGTPFYAGWGLTRDLAPTPARRRRVLTIDQLAAAVLILYPRYLDPVTGLPCPPEVLIDRMADGAAHNRGGWITRLRTIQGRLRKRQA